MNNYFLRMNVGGNETEREGGRERGREGEDRPITSNK